MRRLWPVLLLLAGCGTRELSVPAGEAFPPRFGMIRDRILKPRCVPCHGKIVQYTEVARDLVVPGKPEASEMFREIDGGDMPKYGGKLPSEEIDAIRTWIEKGAAND